MRDALPRPDGRPDLIVGVGNDWRGDDGAGLEVARRLRGVEAVGDPAALLDAWDGADHVIVVDAVRSGAAPGTIHRLDPDCLPAAAALRSTHGAGLAEAIELGRALDRLPARLELYGIEGGCFEPGSGLTPAVVSAVEALCGELRSSQSRQWTPVWRT